MVLVASNLMDFVGPQQTDHLAILSHVIHQLETYTRQLITTTVTTHTEKYKLINLCLVSNNTRYIRHYHSAITNIIRKNRCTNHRLHSATTADWPAQSSFTQ